MRCDKCNSILKFAPGERYKDEKGQTYRIVTFKCFKCGNWSYEKEYINYEEVDGEIRATYRIDKS